MEKTIENALNWRYATKKYDPTFQLTDAQLEALEKSLQLSPSSYGLQPLHYFWINDPELRQKVKEIAWNQQQIIDASAVLILCYKTELDTHYLHAHADLMRDTREMEEAQIAGFRNHLIEAIGKKTKEEIQNWNSKQAYIALGQVLHTSALLEIDATPMEGFSPKALNELLELPQKGLSSALICTFGKRADDDRYQHLKKVRKPLKSLFSRL
ncbi:MAG: NAD(P)H-dependent oxidoreductase [Flavobacteriales bacterium]